MATSTASARRPMRCAWPSTPRDRTAAARRRAGSCVRAVLDAVRGLVPGDAREVLELERLTAAVPRQVRRAQEPLDPRAIAAVEREERIGQRFPPLPERRAHDR